MAIYKYNLPSGSKFTMTVPDGTTQAEADKIFYSQVAAGTFVGYNPGDTLTHPAQALTNFGLSRLQRGTAGVGGISDQALVAITSGLPIVTSLPQLTSVAIENPINDVIYIEAAQETLGPPAVGPLTPTEVQAVIGQLVATVNQPADVISVDVGIGRFGLNAQQLERAGYIKPGYANRYCPLNTSTQQNSVNFVSNMNSPSMWTGKNGVTSANDILNDVTRQDQIQQELMQQSYQQLVSAGLIVPPPATVTTPSVSTGQVYSTSGTLISASALALVATGLGYNGSNALFSDFNNLFSSTGGNAVSSLGSIGNTIAKAFSSLQSDPLGTISKDLSGLGSEAVAIYNSSLGSLQSGAVGFVNNALTSVNSEVTQLTGLATNLSDQASTAVATITSTVKADIGALVANASKYGTEATALWSKGTTAITSLTGTVNGLVTGSLNSIGSLNVSSIKDSISGLTTNLQSSLGTFTGSLGGLSTSLTSSLDALGKASQFSINFADFNLSSLISSVQPAAAFNHTVNRATVDAAVNRIIGSEKISAPVYDLPSFESLGISADIAQAKSLLAQGQAAVTNIGNQVVNIQTQATAALNTAQTQATRISRIV